jgi:hypothetical protein
LKTMLILAALIGWSCVTGPYWYGVCQERIRQRRVTETKKVWAVELEALRAAGAQHNRASWKTHRARLDALEAELTDLGESSAPIR